VSGKWKRNQSRVGRGVGDEAGDGSLHFIPCRHLVCRPGNGQKNELAMIKAMPD
jgi:hypothetical protein